MCLEPIYEKGEKRFYSIISTKWIKNFPLIRQTVTFYDKKNILFDSIESLFLRKIICEKMSEMIVTYPDNLRWIDCGIVIEKVTMSSEMTK
jgi:hypothetical protein